MDLGLTGKVAWVTGGGGGIGSAIATELATEGAKVAITGRTQNRLEARAAEIAAATGAEVISVPADVTSTAEVKAAAASIIERLGGIDIVVNSAATPGGKANGPLETVDDVQMLTDLNEKYISCLRTAQAAAPSMKQRGWGRLIHISGLNARQSGTYSAGGRNLAMVQLSKTLSDELGQHGITSNVVHPGATRGAWWDQRLAAQSAERGIPVADLETEMASTYAIRRLLEPQEIAHVVAFLASPKSVGITGESIGAGGGPHRAVTI
jgi:NAD(P)-dependent dehydrogenase (short-subunit alcohol dehydrogenase family)